MPRPPAPSTDPAVQGPAPLPAGTDPDKAREQEQAALDNVRQGLDDATDRAGVISGQPDGDTQGGPGANNDAAQRPHRPGS